MNPGRGCSLIIIDSLSRFRPRCGSASCDSGRAGDRLHQPTGAPRGLLLLNGGDAHGCLTAVLRGLLEAGAGAASAGARAHALGGVPVRDAAALRAGLVRLQRGRRHGLLRLAGTHVQRPAAEVAVLRDPSGPGVLLRGALPRVLPARADPAPVPQRPGRPGAPRQHVEPRGLLPRLLPPPRAPPHRTDHHLRMISAECLRLWTIKVKIILILVIVR